MIANVSTTVAGATAPWDPAGVLGGIVGGLRGPTLGLMRATLLRPLTLGADVAAAWAITRDVATALLLAALLYGALRAQLAPLAGLEDVPPWRLLPRLAFASLGVAASLPLSRGLLAANNALCSALVQAVPNGPAGVVRPLAGGLLPFAPAALGIGPDVAALLVLVGVAALACFYVIRAAEIVLLTLLLPLAAALWVVPAASGVYRVVFGHLVVSVFVQSAQVVVLLVFATGMGIGAPTTGTDWLWAIGALTLLFRCRGFLTAMAGTAAQWIPEPSRLAPLLGPLVTGSVRTAERLRAGAARIRDVAGL